MRYYEDFPQGALEWPKVKLDLHISPYLKVYDLVQTQTLCFAHNLITQRPIDQFVEEEVKMISF